ncbi:unnamed protein product [Rotaria sordida]|uniref:Uncharacterized protein n=1 Tax=Rotaria sordida TaxID=392033 RepID=A0A815EGE9_9BILA|nr:unnamed protein product [Rotaria sordida]CAF1106224.1 unnamed protein product [Rotaria sordida]CAF1306137.1 unnamed protein product [Rotaria sordida]CAF1314427.1 unnamed protein product [Rotaria sordida]
MHATLIIFIDREEQNSNYTDITTGEYLMNSNISHALNAECNTFLDAHNMAYRKAMKYLKVDTTNEQREDQVHGGVLLLNKLLRVSDIKFENICQDLIHPYCAPKPKPVSYKAVL